MATPAEADETPTDNKCPARVRPWSDRKRAEEIPCPALLSFYSNGLLDPDEDGISSTEALSQALEKAGVNSTVAKVLVKQADESDGASDNRFDLLICGTPSSTTAGAQAFETRKWTPPNSKVGCSTSARTVACMRSTLPRQPITLARMIQASRAR